jgi:LysR family transcriptional regulator of abg operon
MKLNQIRDVVAIADHGSLRAAAQFLGVAQPALTRSIRELEHELGVSLFERHPRGMALTALGEAFIARMRVVQSELQRSRDEMEQMSGRLTGQVTIGLSMACNIALLPGALGPFKKRFPKVRLKVVEGLFPELRKHLLDATLDFYVGPVIDRPVPREFAVETLLENECAIFARKGHPLRSAKSLTALADAQWIGTQVTDRYEQELGPLFRAHGMRPPHIETEATSALSSLIVVANTDLLAMLPRQYLRYPGMSELLQPIRIKEKLNAPDICLVTRSGLPLTPAAEFFSDLIRRTAVAESRRATR